MAESSISQGDFYCRASSQADFILNYFLSNVLKFPQISPNFLSNSPFPTSRLAGWNNYSCPGNS